MALVVAGVVGGAHPGAVARVFSATALGFLRRGFFSNSRMRTSCDAVRSSVSIGTPTPIVMFHRGAHPEEERECEEFFHGEVEVLCVVFCEEVMRWEPCM